jgi:hypothetical protein
MLDRPKLTVDSGHGIELTKAALALFDSSLQPSMSSLFGSDDDSDDVDADAKPTVETAIPSCAVANDKASAAIAGLHLFKGLLPVATQDTLVRSIADAHAVSTEHPQAMFFPRSTTANDDTLACPEFLVPFVLELPNMLHGLLSEEEYAIVFDKTRSLQTILNLYEPGKGISPHVRSAWPLHLTEC